MNNNKLTVGLLIVGLTAIAGLFFPLVRSGNNSGTDLGAAGTRFQNGISVGTTVSPSGAGLLVGTNGTELDGLKVGSCTIWAPANTISATSTQQIVCQTATDGSLASGLTGVTADSICSLTMASSTNATLGSLVVAGASASSTAGSIVGRLVNLTGTTFTWTAAASSSSQWMYSCFDPN